MTDDRAHRSCRSSRRRPTSSSPPTSGRPGCRPGSGPGAEDRAPRPAGLKYVSGTTPSASCPDDAPPCGLVRGQALPHKRHVAAVGFGARRRDAVAITTTRCAPAAEPKARVEGRSPTTSRRRCRSRPSRASAARPSPRPGTRSSPGPASTPTTTTWSRVVRGLRRRPHPLIIVPLWDVEAHRRRGAPQRRAGRAGGDLQRIPARLSPPALRLLGPFFQACEDTGTVVCAHRLVVADAGDLARRPAGGRRRR